MISVTEVLLEDPFSRRTLNQRKEMGDPAHQAKNKEGYYTRHFQVLIWFIPS